MKQSIQEARKKTRGYAQRKYKEGNNKEKGKN